MATEGSGLNPWETVKRTTRHSRDPVLEESLKRLNDHLAKASPLLTRPAGPQHPVLFVVGCARGGSTLLMQWLASSGLVAYPSNIISRFYGDPMVGALVQRVLHDLDHRGEIFPEREASEDFESELGRTRGPISPHDFGYFWRRFFRFGAQQHMLLEQPDGPAIARLRGDVAGIEEVFSKPVLLKAMELNWHIPILRAIFPNSVFLFVQRSVPENATSILKARVSYFGTDTAWYSYKPQEFDAIKNLPPWEQAVAQVWLTNRAVRTGLSGIPHEDVLDVRYERFCEAPAELHSRLCKRLGIEAGYIGSSSFTARSKPIEPGLSSRASRLLERLEAGEYS